jgi:hypothetical protein
MRTGASHDLLIEDFLGRSRTRPAACGDTQLSAKFVKRADAASCGPADLLVGDGVADADEHGVSDLIC